MSMSLPKHPRQKMINLLYVVLIAMLALNVSAEILNAFKIVDQSINHSNSSIDEKNNLIYQQFEKQMAQDPKKVGPLKAKAEEVRAQSKEMNAFIEDLKEKIIQQSGGYTDEGKIKRIDDLDASSRIMINKKNGPELKKRIKEVRANFLGYFDENDRASEEKIFPLRIVEPEGKKGKKNKKSWTEFNFGDIPTIAAITILDKFKSDVKNAEGQVLDYLYSQINAQQFTMDTYTPLVSANSGYVMDGQKYEAKIMLGAYSSTVDPTITVNGNPIDVENGVGTFSTIASGVGEHSYDVAVKLKDKNGKVQAFTTSGSYMVGASSLSVSATKMNVLFVGLDNPISIAAAGVPAANLNVSISQGSLKKVGTGKYVARVTDLNKDAVVHVSGNIDGQNTNLGNMKFRVMRVPDPVAMVGNSEGGRMRSAVFKAQEGVRAVLKNFYFDIRFKVTSFTMGFVGSGFSDYYEAKTSSAVFSSEMHKLMKRCKPGTRIFIDDIRAKGPDGTTRALPGITFKLY